MRGFCLGIAYSASIGGAGSLVGTTPNLVLKGHFDKFHKDANLNFVTYMAFSLPISVHFKVYTFEKKF
jgi:sodium-dependent dicarboxylate transporter 2/3/5